MNPAHGHAALLAGGRGATVRALEKAAFVVRLADLERGPRRVTFALSEAWLRDALSDTEAVPEGPGEASVELMKTGDFVIVRGRAKVNVRVPCVVTLDPLSFELSPEIFLQLGREPEPAPRSKGGGRGDGKAGKGGAKSGARGAGGGKAKRRLQDDAELSPEEAAYDTFRGEEIALDDFFREFILLEIPAYPRRSDLPSPEEGISSRALGAPPEEAKPLDPRLAPLLGIASRLKGSANKE